MHASACAGLDDNLKDLRVHDADVYHLPEAE